MLVGSAADLGAEWVLEEGQKMGDSGGVWRSQQIYKSPYLHTSSMDPPAIHPLHHQQRGFSVTQTYSSHSIAYSPSLCLEKFQLLIMTGKAFCNLIRFLNAQYLV